MIWLNTYELQSKLFGPARTHHTQSQNNGAPVPFTSSKFTMPMIWDSYKYHLSPCGLRYAAYSHILRGGILLFLKGCADEADSGDWFRRTDRECHEITRKILSLI